MNGDFQWVKFIGGSTVQFNDIKIDNQQNVILSCQTDFEIYFYFDLLNYTLIPAIATYTTMGGANVWEGSNTFYVKIGSDGSAKWVNYIEHPDPNWPQRIVIDNQDNITVETFCGSNLDLTATNGTFNLNAIGITKFIKFDSLGNFISIKSALYRPNGIDTDKNGYIYCSGTLTNPVDFDLGPGNSVLNTPYPVPYLAKYDSDLNLQWAGKMGKGTTFGHFDFSDSSKIYFAGSYSSTFNAEPNLDMNYSMTSQGSSDIFFAQYKSDTCGNLFLAIDSFQNILCSTLLGSVFSHAGNGVPPYSYSWNTTPASFLSQMNTGVPGDFTGTVLDSLGCSASAFVRVGGSPYLNDIDLGVNSGGGSFRTGMQSNLWLNVYNDGCVPSAGALKLILDTAVVFNSSVPLPTSQNGDTLTWIFLPLDYNSAHFMPVVSLTPTSTILGSFLNFNAIVEPLTGDVDTSNNHRRCRFLVSNSFDPNAKSVFPFGDGFLGKTENNQTMTYTVHFQNTGNANALNISILDSIDIDLDIYSLRVVATSHPLTYTSLIGNNAVRFYFNTINLPDSATDQLGSNGYVIYEIKQKTNLPHLTQITNTAYIYFDFNPAVITNTVLNTIDLSTAVIENKEGENGITIYPNPVEKSMIILLDNKDENLCVSIYDSQGKQIKLPFAISRNQIIVDTKDLQQGIYNAVITFLKTGENRSCKFIRM